jgi:hypothetical protein
MAACAVQRHGKALGAVRKGVVSPRRLGQRDGRHAELAHRPAERDWIGRIDWPTLGDCASRGARLGAWGGRAVEEPHAALDVAHERLEEEALLDRLGHEELLLGAFARHQQRRVLASFRRLVCRDQRDSRALIVWE